MDVLIIGGTRFLGKYLTEALLKGNQNVTLLNRGTRRNIFPFYEDVEWLICDRQDADKFRSLLKNRQFDVVIDTSAYFPSDAEQVVEIFRDKIAKYIFTSSMAVALTKEFRERQLMPIPNRRLFDTEPGNSYAYNKTLIEEYLTEQFDKNGFPFVSLRPAEIMGPGEMREWYYIDRLKHGREKILIPGSGENLFQPVYIDDLVQAFLLAIVKENGVGKCYNIAGAEAIGLNQFIRLIAAAMEERVKIINIPHSIFRDLVSITYYFPYVYKYSFVTDIEKARQELGYQPEVGIRQSIRKILASWRKDYTPKVSPFSPRGEYELMSYDLEDIFISAWELETSELKDRLRQKLLDKGLLI
ncbi:MAG: NAD-dependent epimerase/dehydratase family protein [Calditrichaeota bacterium]|nr:NAD-dependent epimerase/dehydratase family protein [Calditrichota bacterium]